MVALLIVVVVVFEMRVTFDETLQAHVDPTKRLSFRIYEKQRDRSPHVLEPKANLPNSSAIL